MPVPNTWGGRRPGAGRKPAGPRAGVPHRARPWHDPAHPIHLTLRAASGLPSLRDARALPAISQAIGSGSSERFRVVHFSLRRDHVHLIVEARHRLALAKGAKGLSVRLARAINRAFGRTGRVWGDRYHARPLGTPREVRNALVFVFGNARKHGAGHGRLLDPCSSARWFDGWRDLQVPPETRAAPPVVPAETWLLRAGWRRHGLIASTERPAR